MKKVEAVTLEEAFEKAAKFFKCSISELQYEVVQHPTKGVLGFMQKNAIIVATSTKLEYKEVKKDKIAITLPTEEESVASEILTTVKESQIVEKNDVLDNFFETETVEAEEEVVYDELGLLIENQLKELLSHSCFDIDVVEVDVHDNTALIFIDGEDAALLIGKEGYRYNALSYMLFNWLHSKYELFIKLEIAEFLTKQQEMIRAYIKPLIVNIEKNGRGKTRFLDGILVQIALEQLRERFPNKYVAIKSSKDGKKFVVINEFNTKPNA